MAHEVLKFNVFVDKKKLWQPIIGDVCHGTFFMVYINIKELIKIKDKFKYIIDLRLQNYHGKITIGLTGTPEIELRDKKADEDAIQKEIKRINQLRRESGLPIMTEEEKRIFKINHKLDYNLHIPVQPFNNTFVKENIEFDLIDEPLNDKILNSICTPKNPPNNLYDVNNVENSLYINPEHYIRFGDEFSQIGYRPKNVTGKFNTFNRAGTQPLSKCIPSRSFLI